MSFAAGTIIDTIDGNIPIEKLPKTGMVKTYDGTYVPFVYSGACGTEYTVILTLSAGEHIICTPDQLFLADDDWVEAKDSVDKYFYDEYNVEDSIQVKSIRVGGARLVYRLGVGTGDFCLAGNIIVTS